VGPSSEAACGSSPGSVCPEDLPPGGPESDDDANLLQLGGSARKQEPQTLDAGDGDSSLEPVYVPKGMLQRDVSDGKIIMDFFMPPKKMAKPGHQCNRTEFLDCLSDEVKKRCAEECGVQEEMLALVEEGAAARGHTQGTKQARNAIVSRIQSLMEKKYKELNSNKSLPEDVHDALLTLDKILASIRQDSEGSGSSLLSSDSSSPHATDLGYPLTAVEAILFTFGLIDSVIEISKDSVTAQVYRDWVNKYILRHGWNSKQAHDFYNAAIYLNEPPFPLDLGWINEFLGTMGTYAYQKGVHAYRKTPWQLTKGYDFSYSVYELPESKDKPLVVGLVADWGSGSPQALSLLKEMKKQKPDIVIHLGDTYYSGTPQEAREFWLDPMRAVFASKTTILQVPGNHDYYSEGGKGFFEVIDELGHQEASFFALRGKHWQILGLDTGLLSNFNLLFPIGSAELQQAMMATMPFLPQDQLAWALHQLEVGRKLGLKTIVVSHHQLFSRHEPLGVANAAVDEASTVPDRVAMTYASQEFRTKSADLPGNLSNDALPLANTRLLNQFSPDVLKGISAWYWGHEHTAATFKPYAGLERGRLIGNAALLVEKDIDIYAACEECDGTPWGGPPELISGSETGHGDTWWNLGFVTVTLDGENAQAQHFQMQDTRKTGEMPVWSSSSMFYQESY